MNVEERLARLKPRKATDEIFERARAGRKPRRAHWKEIPMLVAAGALVAVLVTVLMPAAQDNGKPVVQDDGWLDREPAASDLPAETVRAWEARVAQLGDNDQEVRDRTHREIEASIDVAIVAVRAAKDSPDAEVRSRVAKLIESYEKRPKLLPAVARARKEGKTTEEQRALAARLFESDDARAKLREAGWHVAPAVAEACAKQPFARALEVRGFLRELCKPLFEQRTKVVLEKRGADNYAAASYSFLHASQDVKTHGNLVALVYNNCGLLHAPSTSGVKNRIAALGAVEMADVREAPDKGWRDESVVPREGHVYVFEGSLAMAAGPAKKYAVKFIVTEVAADRITIEWAPLGEPFKGPRMSARNGEMGQCGLPPHGEK